MSSFRLLLGIMVAVVCLTGEVPAGEASSFVAGTQDLPLMPGLREAPASGMLFETAEGRIVESYAVGNVSPNEILSFYASTLPSLGWQRESDTVYHRDAETLRLKITSNGQPVTIVFTIMPE